MISKEIVSEQAEKKEALGSVFRGTLASAGAGISAFFSYVHYAFANATNTYAANILAAGRADEVSATYGNKIVDGPLYQFGAQYVHEYYKLLATVNINTLEGLAFGGAAVAFIAYGIYNFKNAWRLSGNKATKV